MKWSYKFCNNETEKTRQEIIDSLEKIKYRLKRVIPGSRIILAGSLAYGEANVQREDKLEFNSDVDVFVISNNIKALKYMAKKLGKRSLLEGINIPKDKLEIFFIWKPLLSLNGHLATGKDLDTGKIVMFGNNVDNEIRYNSLKKAYICIIKAKNEKFDENLAYAGTYCVRAKMHNDFAGDSIFRLKSNLEWLETHDYFTEDEKKVLIKCIKYRLGENIPLNKKDMEQIKDILNNIFNEKKQSFKLSYNLQYVYFCVKNKILPSLFTNYSQALLEMLYDYANETPEKSDKKIRRIFKKNSVSEEELLKLVKFNILRN